MSRPNLAAVAAAGLAVAALLGTVVLAAQAPAGRAAGPGPQGGGFVAYPQRPPADPAAVERGKGMYSVNCGFCHGADARGGDMGPNLLRSQVVLNDLDGELIAPVVLKGRPPRMPPFSLNDTQVKDLAAFLHSFPVSSRTGPSEIDIVIGNAAAGETYFKAKCAACHSATGDLRGVGAKYADPKGLQQTWLLPGSGGTRAGGPPRFAPPITAIVTLPSGERVEGALQRIDDFVVSLRQADGTLRSFRTIATGSPRVELRDPLQGHRDLLPGYSDSDIHNVTAYLVTLK